MSLFVRIRDTIYHIPSISSITLIRSKILKRPIIYISYHRGKGDKIKYSSSTGEYQKDYMTLITSFNSYNDHIREIPIFSNQTVVDERKNVSVNTVGNLTK